MLCTVLAAAMTASIAADNSAGAPHAGTGASLAWTSRDSVVVEARQIALAGRLAEAEQLLTDRADAPGGADAAAARAEMRETLRRIRRDYAQTLDGLVTRFDRSIPGVTAEDVERWRRAGGVQARLIDGQIGYFIREPSNIFRFCDEAKRRRAAASALRGPSASAAPDPEATLNTHLREVIAAAERNGATEVLPVRHRITYKLTVKPDRPNAKKGSVLRCWLPFPQEYRQQKNVKLIRTMPEAHTTAPNAVDTVPMGGAPQRTVYFEQTIDDPTKPVTFEEEFEYTSFAYYPVLVPSVAQPLPHVFDRVYLQERPPHILFTPELRDLIDRLTASEPNPLQRLRRIYHWINDHIWYCAEREYAIIPSFTEKVLQSRRGDCGIQSMLLITMCRVAGLPARWQSGWETRPDEWNMHDWAEVYIAPWGWLPVDMSYNLRKSDDPKVREFYIGHQDAYRMIVNLDYGADLQPPHRSLRSEPADFQRGEVELDGCNLYFDDWDYEIQIDRKPAE